MTKANSCTERGSLWVVEVKKEDGSWEATNGVSFTRREGMADLAEWRLDNAEYHYRLRKYVRSE